MPQFPFPEGDGFGGIAFHEVSCRRFVFVLGHDGDRYAEYGRLSGGGSLFEDGPRVTSASTRSTASPSSCPVPSLSPSSGGRLNEFPSLQSAALVGFTRSAGRNDGWLGHSCGFRARAPLSMADNGCLLAAFAFAQFLGCFMRLGQLFLLCPASYGVLSNSFFDARGHRSRTMLKSHKSVMKITKSCRKV